MGKGMNIRAVAIIPARGGSRGLPGKNIKQLCGKPVLAYSIEAAQEANYVDRIIDTTDSDEIGAVAESCGAEFMKRPAYLAEDEVSLDSVIIHAVKMSQTEAELVVTLQPTAPVRPSGLVDACVERLVDYDAKGLLTVHEGPHFAWQKYGRQAVPLNSCMRKMRQAMRDEERIYLENGSCYVTIRNELMRTLNRIPRPLAHYEIPPEYGVDIDTEYDFWLAEKRLEYMAEQVPA
jgi:N-acylneuraminate cytidylyltransferase